MKPIEQLVKVLYRRVLNDDQYTGNLLDPNVLANCLHDAHERCTEQQRKELNECVQYPKRQAVSCSHGIIGHVTRLRQAAGYENRVLTALLSRYNAELIDQHLAIFEGFLCTKEINPVLHRIDAWMHAGKDCRTASRDVPPLDFPQGVLRNSLTEPTGDCADHVRTYFLNAAGKCGRHVIALRRKHQQPCYEAYAFCLAVEQEKLSVPGLQYAKKIILRQIEDMKKEQDDYKTKQAPAKATAINTVYNPKKNKKAGYALRNSLHIQHEQVTPLGKPKFLSVS